jgi:hypothetical protein
LTLSLRIVALGIHSLNNILNINNILNLNSIFTLNLRTVLRNWRSWSQKIKFIRKFIRGLASGSRSRSGSRLSNSPPFSATGAPGAKRSIGSEDGTAAGPDPDPDPDSG